MRPRDGTGSAGVARVGAAAAVHHTRVGSWIGRRRGAAQAAVDGVAVGLRGRARRAAGLFHPVTVELTEGRITLLLAAAVRAGEDGFVLGTGAEREGAQRERCNAHGRSERSSGQGPARAAEGLAPRRQKRAAKAAGLTAGPPAKRGHTAASIVQVVCLRKLADEHMDAGSASKWCSPAAT